MLRVGRATAGSTWATLVTAGVGGERITAAVTEVTGEREVIVERATELVLADGRGVIWRRLVAEAAVAAGALRG